MVTRRDYTAEAVEAAKSVLIELTHLRSSLLILKKLMIRKKWNESLVTPSRG